MSLEAKSQTATLEIFPPQAPRLAGVALFLGVGFPLATPVANKVIGAGSSRQRQRRAEIRFSRSTAEHPKPIVEVVHLTTVIELG